MDTGFDFNRVAMFVQIANAGGVTAAASQLKVPKSSVSRGLSQLEADLGVELVVRSSRSFRLTEAGRSFLREASKGIATVDNAREAIRRERAAPQGLVRIAAPGNIATTLLPFVIAQFVREHPKVHVDLTVTAREVLPVRDGFDLVFALGKRADASSKLRSIGSVDLGVFASPTYLAERGTPQRPVDLAKHECVLRSGSASSKKDRWKLTGPNGTVVVRVDGHIRVDELLGAYAAAAAHAGLALLPIHRPAEATGETLVRVLPDYVMRGEAVHLVYPAQRHVPLPVTMLVDSILVHAKNTCPKGS